MQHTNSGGVIDTKFYWTNVQFTERYKSNSRRILLSTGRIYLKLGKSWRQNQGQERLSQTKNKVVYLGRDQTGKARNRQGCYWELNPKINVRKSGIEPQITWPKECWILGLDGLKTGGESHVCYIALIKVEHTDRWWWVWRKTRIHWKTDHHKIEVCISLLEKKGFLSILMPSFPRLGNKDSYLD